MCKSVCIPAPIKQVRETSFGHTRSVPLCATRCRRSPARLFRNARHPRHARPRKATLSGMCLEVVRLQLTPYVLPLFFGRRSGGPSAGYRGKHRQGRYYGLPASLQPQLTAPSLTCSRPWSAWKSTTSQFAGSQLSSSRASSSFFFHASPLSPSPNGPPFPQEPKTSPPPPPTTQPQCVSSTRSNGVYSVDVVENPPMTLAEFKEYADKRAPFPSSTATAGFAGAAAVGVRRGRSGGGAEGIGGGKSGGVDGDKSKGGRGNGGRGYGGGCGFGSGGGGARRSGSGETRGSVFAAGVFGRKGRLVREGVVLFFLCGDDSGARLWADGGGCRRAAICSK